MPGDLFERMALAAARASLDGDGCLEPHLTRLAEAIAPVWRPEMEAAARELLAVMREEAVTCMRLRSFARRHGLDAPAEAASPSGLQARLASAERTLADILHEINGAEDDMPEDERAACHEVAERILDVADCLATALLPYDAAVAL